MTTREHATRVGRFKAYPEYRDSGVEWLGDVPTHWADARVTELTTLINGYPFDSEHFTLDSGTPLVRIRDLDDAETEVNYVGPPIEGAWIVPGDLIIGMDGDFNVARWRGRRAFLNQRLCCLRPRQNSDAVFISYLLPFPLKVINDLTYSTTVKHLSSGDVRKIRLAAPSPDEQHAIAVFLDRETARIDALVVKKQRLIELLREQRTALITHAVTRGLDPNAPIVDSGVEWLGGIPKHWEVKRLKYVVAEPLKYGANEPAELIDPELPRYIRITDIRDDGVLRDDTFRSIPEDVAAPHLLSEGDLLFARSGATVGKTFHYDPSWGKAAHAGYLIRARLDDGRSRSRFVHYFTQSRAYWDWLQANFIQATIQNVNAERYASLVIPVPPITEQDRVIHGLDVALAHIDRLLAKVGDAIDRLRELRTALISAAVTGKIDVREEIA